jgi:hypothetical protein
MSACLAFNQLWSQLTSLLRMHHCDGHVQQPAGPPAPGAVPPAATANTHTSHRTHAGGAVLDLCSSWVSHLPKEVSYSRVVGHGLNAAELARNPRLDTFFVRNLNAEPDAWALADQSFDAVVMCVRWGPAWLGTGMWRTGWLARWVAASEHHTCRQCVERRGRRLVSMAACCTG